MKTLQEQLKSALQIKINEDSINDNKKAIANKIKEINKAFTKSEDEYDEFVGYYIEGTADKYRNLEDEDKQEYDEAVTYIEDFKSEIKNIQKNIINYLKKMSSARTNEQLKKLTDEARDKIGVIVDGIAEDIEQRVVRLLRVFDDRAYLSDGVYDCGFYSIVEELCDWLDDFKMDIVVDEE